MKQKKITHTMQNVAVDILQDFEILIMSSPNRSYTEDAIIEIIKKHEKKYALYRDIFTGMICTYKEAIENKDEYDRQNAEMKYGHSDWLD